MMRSTFLQLKNRVLQLLALYAPGAETVRVWLHRRRGVRIGERVFVGTAAILETERPDLISIGDDVTLGIRVVIVAHFKGTYGVTIGDEAFLGPGVIVLPGVEIGRGSVVTAGSVVTKNVPPHTIVQGNPARPIARCELPLTEDMPFDEFQKHVQPL